jgi:hypothetical protein
MIRLLDPSSILYPRSAVSRPQGGRIFACRRKYAALWSAKIAIARLSEFSAAGMA